MDEEQKQDEQEKDENSPKEDEELDEQNPEESSDEDDAMDAVQQAVEKFENFDMEAFEDANAFKKIQMLNELKNAVMQAGSAAAKTRLTKLLKYALEEKILDKWLDQTINRYRGQDKFLLNPIDYMRFKRAKKHKKLKRKCKELDLILKANFVNFCVENIEVVGPVLLILLLVVGIIVIALVVVLSIFGGLDEAATNPNSMSSVSGAGADKFYGVRTVYQNDDKAAQEILENYLKLTQNAVETIPENNAAYTLTVTLEFPENFDFLDEEAEYNFNSSELLQILVAGSYIYDAEDEDLTLPLTEQAKQIKYFGLNETLNTYFGNTIANYIKVNNLYTITPIGEGSADDYKTQAETVISNAISTYFANNSNIRTEKLFVEDFIFDEDHEAFTCPGKNKYVALIYLPKEDVTFNYVSYMSKGSPLFEMEIYVDNTLIQILDKDYETTEDENGNEVIIYMLESEENLNLTQEKVEESEVGFNNKNSLFDLLMDSEIDLTNFLTETEEENVKTLTISGFHIKITTLRPMMLAEFEIETE